MSRSFDILQRAEGLGGGSYVPITSSTIPQSGISDRRHNLSERIDQELIKLIQRVFILTSAVQAPSAVTFAGVDHAVGCSWVCAHAGEMLAEQVAGTVCLVDANLRSPSLRQHFRLINGPGFTESMKGTEPLHEFAHQVSGNQLWLITAGATGKEPNGLLNPPMLRTRFAELRDHFDYVLVDTPAIQMYGDAALLAQLTDGIILVVGSNTTRRERARMAKETMEAAQVPILGAVLNRRKFPMPEMIYRKL